MNFGKILSSLAKQENMIGRGAKRVGLEMDMANYRKLGREGKFDESEKLYPTVGGQQRGLTKQEMAAGQDEDLLFWKHKELERNLERSIYQAKETGDYGEFNKLMKEKMELDRLPLTPALKQRLYPEINENIPF